MPFFDFLKSNNRNDLSFESVFDKAADDIAYRPMFYKKLLDAELFLLTQDHSGHPEKKFITDENTKISVRFFSNGIVPLFTSKERIFDGNVIKGQVHTTSLNARSIFKMFNSDTDFIINPYSIIRKELLAIEVKSLLEGDFFKPDDEQIIQPNEDILIGMPTDYPINLVETLKRYFDLRPVVKSAYLALIENKTRREFPHLLLGVDCKKGSWPEIQVGLTILVKDYLKDDEIMDFVHIQSSEELSSFVKLPEFRIY